MFIKQIEDFVYNQHVTLPNNTELVLELVPQDGDSPWMCGYYFIDHESRSLFWPEEFEADYLLQEVKGVTQAYQISEYLCSLTLYLADTASSRACDGSRILVSAFHATSLIRWQASPWPSHRNHWELFPMYRQVTSALVDELREILLHAAGGTCSMCRYLDFADGINPLHRCHDFPYINFPIYI
jgi:hypothetical protein